MRHSFQVIKLGRLSYAEGLRKQEHFTNIAKSAKSCDSPKNFLLALEHNPVYTVGIRSKFYSAEEEKRLVSLGADFHRTSRGGLITFHGPGQLVLYPIFDLRRISQHSHGARTYVNALEEVIIRCATDVFKVPNVGRTENTGVWVGADRKLAALGVAVSHGISYHGLALNCNTDLSWFDHIVGCGIEGVETTSLSRECRRDISPDEVLPHMLNTFSNVFNCSFSL